jgi:hypothetical protein
VSFTAQELAETKTELTAQIAKIFSKQTNPDVLFGNHPTVAVASRMQSIAIWHGNRIEQHLSDWINRVPNWNAKVRERVVIGGMNCEIDNLASNPTLGVVLAVEAKRVWDNQDKRSRSEMRDKHKLYTAAKLQIVSHAGVAGGDFRYFVFDAFGDRMKGDGGLPIIAGDKIENVFSDLLSNYVKWERQVMSNILLPRLDLAPEIEFEEELRAKVLEGSTRWPKDRQQVLDYIDRHA